MVGYQLGPDYLGAFVECPGCGEQHSVVEGGIDHVVCTNEVDEQTGEPSVYVVGIDGKKAHYDKKSYTIEVTDAYRDEDGKFAGWVDDDEEEEA